MLFRGCFPEHGARDGSEQARSEKAGCGAGREGRSRMPNSAPGFSSGKTVRGAKFLARSMSKVGRKIVMTGPPERRGGNASP
jgi:hypothetical protein